VSNYAKLKNRFEKLLKHFNVLQQTHTEEQLVSLLCCWISRCR